MAVASAPSSSLAAARSANWDFLLIAPLEELQRRCAHRETQERILQAMHQLLHSCGAGLRHGWLLVLSILWRAAKKHALLPLLPLAIRSVTQIASDFLPVLPPTCLLAYVELAAAYALQVEHLNVSLAAIGLQWTISDYLVEYAIANPDDAEAVEGEEEPGIADADADEEELVSGVPSDPPEADAAAASLQSSQADSEAAEALDEEGGGSALASAPRYVGLDVDEKVKSHKLWCAILLRLRLMCKDERPEVRTCAMHTLTSVTTSHGTSLTGRSWDFALFRVLLPLTREVSEAAAAANTQQPVAQTLGTEGGRPVLMLLHHSRDTASKQWDETWVLLLNSLTRLFRTFLPLLQQRPNFNLAWEELLGFCERSLLASPRSLEVAKAAIAALVQELLLSTVVPRSASFKSLTPPGPIADAAAAAVANSGSAGTTGAAGGGGAAKGRERLPPTLWTSAWGLVESIVATTTDGKHTFAAHEPMLVQLLEQLNELYSSTRERFEEADVMRLLKLAATLATPPTVLRGWDPLQPPKPPSPLQLAALRLLEALPPFPSAVCADNLWPLLLYHLLKLIEVRQGEGAPPEPPSRSSSTTPVGISERAYKLLYEMLTVRADAAARVGIAEDVLQVTRAVLRWRLHPSCRSPALPKAVASTFVPLLDSVVPLIGALPAEQAETAVGAQKELVATVWVLLAPSLPNAAAAFASALADAAELTEASMRLPTELSEEDSALEVQILKGVRRACSTLSRVSPAALRAALLRVFHAALALPPNVATTRDAAWTESLAALCYFASGASPPQPPAEVKAEVKAEAEAQAEAKAEAKAAKAEAEGGADTAAAAAATAAASAESAALAAPMLVDAAAKALADWSSPGSPSDSCSRAKQLVRLLDALISLRLPDGALAGTGSGGGVERPDAIVAAREGARGHLVQLAPALIAAIGTPQQLEFAPTSVQPELLRLQCSVREALQVVTLELCL